MGGGTKRTKKTERTVGGEYSFGWEVGREGSFPVLFVLFVLCVFRAQQ